jgi:hypothetical protein
MKVYEERKIILVEIGEAIYEISELKGSLIIVKRTGEITEKQLADNCIKIK